jgi:hypothetical protein
MSTSMGERFHIIIEDGRDPAHRNVPTAARVRSLLKIAGRGLGLRAVEVRPAEDEPIEVNVYGGGQEPVRER